MKKGNMFLIIIISVFFIACTVEETSDSMIKSVREPVFAGTWYPGDYTSLKNSVDDLLDKAENKGLHKIKALIVPHAGYAYSGGVAGSGFKQIEDDYDTVILMGPSHKYPLKGASIMNVTHYKTPLGEVKLSEKIKSLLDENDIRSVPEAHFNEHSIEIELPFLQEILDDFELIPIIVGDVDTELFAEILARYLDDNTLLVVSADLSHYHPYNEALELDASCISSILNMDDISGCEIDAKWAVSSVIDIAKGLMLNAELIEYKNSGDVTGYKDNGVVGYSAIAFYDGLSKEEQDLLAGLARDSMESYVNEKKVFEPDMKAISEYPRLMKKQAAFVSLTKSGMLRGSIGHLVPYEELYLSVRDNAISAVSRDKRFQPVEPDELKDITATISVLDIPVLVDVKNYSEYLIKLKPFKDGVIIVSKGKQSTYLPSVWEQLPDKREFLGRLCVKGGSAYECWKDPDTKIYRYSAQIIHET